MSIDDLEASVPAGYTEDDVKKRIFIGARYDKYYKEKFDQINPKKPFVGFNFGAFIFGPMWFLYRKMYAYASIYVAFIFVIQMVFLIFELNTSGTNGGSIGLAVAIGILANGIYKRFVEKKIKFVEDTNVVNVELEIEERGGTDVIAPSLFIIIVGLLIYLSS